MIPELGQMALVLALCMALAQSFFGLVGCTAGHRLLDDGSTPGSDRPIPVHRPGVPATGLFPAAQRFLGTIRRAELQHRASLDLQDRGRPGAPMRARCCCGPSILALVDPGSGRVQPESAAGVQFPGAGRDGHRQHRVPVIHAHDLRSVHAPAAGGAAGRRSQSDPPGPGHGRPSAHALHGLCGPLGGLRIRGGGPARRQDGFHLGALGAALDHRRLAVPDLRHHPRQLVVLLRTRLGRLVVLGSGRECLVHAMAGSHRTDPFPDRHREARHVQELDRACSPSPHSP